MALTVIVESAILVSAATWSSADEEDVVLLKKSSVAPERGEGEAREVKAVEELRVCCGHWKLFASVPCYF